MAGQQAREFAVRQAAGAPVAGGAATAPSDAELKLPMTVSTCLRSSAGSALYGMAGGPPESCTQPSGNAPTAAPSSVDAAQRTFPGDTLVTVPRRGIRASSTSARRWQCARIPHAVRQGCSRRVPGRRGRGATGCGCSRPNSPPGNPAAAVTTHPPWLGRTVTSHPSAVSAATGARGRLLAVDVAPIVVTDWFG